MEVAQESMYLNLTHPEKRPRYLQSGRQFHPNPKTLLYHILGTFSPPTNTPPSETINLIYTETVYQTTRQQTTGKQAVSKAEEGAKKPPHSFHRKCHTSSSGGIYFHFT